VLSVWLSISTKRAWSIHTSLTSTNRYLTRCLMMAHNDSIELNSGE
jgi:hypothetical protein